MMDAVDRDGPVPCVLKQEFFTPSSEVDLVCGLSDSEMETIIEIKPIKDEDIEEGMTDDMNIQAASKDEGSVSVHSTISMKAEGGLENNSYLPNLTESGHIKSEGSTMNASDGEVSQQGHAAYVSHSKAEADLLQQTTSTVLKYPNLCTVCGKRCKGKGGLVLHMRRIHTPYTCEMCSKAFTSKLALDDHKKIHTNTKNYDNICIVCGETCTGEGGLENHMRQHTKGQMYPCGDSEETFSKALEGTAHKKRVHKVTQSPSYPCSVCGMAFPGKEPLSKHLEVHRWKPKTYPCDQCDKVFSLYKQRHAHIMKDHRQHGRVTCTLCGVVCRGNSGLSKHKMLHRLNYFRTHPCRECDRVFDKESRMRFHLRSVHGKSHSWSKRPACNICGQTFAKNYMATHMKTHNRDQKPSQEALAMSLHHACEVCGKEFATYSQLNIHKQIHRAWYCTVCGVQFSSPHTSKEHRDLNPGHTVIQLTKETDPTPPAKIKDSAVVSDDDPSDQSFKMN